MLWITDRSAMVQGRLGSYCFNGQNVGPKRVWLASQNIPGLSMTRSFGDSVAASVGVIAEPEVREITLTPEDKYLVRVCPAFTAILLQVLTPLCTGSPVIALKSERANGS